MRQALWVVLLALGALPAPAAAQIHLTWNECPLDPGASSNRINVCTGNIGEQSLYCSFVLPAAVDSVLGVDLVLDLQHSLAGIPDWWQFEPESCRFGALRASFDFALNPWCSDFWLNVPAGGVQAYEAGPPRWSQDRARIRLSAVLPSTELRALAAGAMYYAARLTISNAHTVAPAPCGGCDAPACIVLNSIALRRLPGAAGGDLVLQDAAQGPPPSNFATWQGGGGADCQAVPARSVTWGRVKSLYR